ncbi:MAG TPA: hypothetical protein VGE01_13945 [Fimbriimonas sp.]
MEHDRSYTEQEVARIIRRAGELQANRPEAPSVGLRSEDLKRVAEELGIDPRFVDQAIQEGVGQRSSNLGLTSTVERVYEGEPDFDRMAETVAMSGSWGPFATRVGNVFVNTVRKGGGHHFVTVKGGGGRTSIRVKSTAALAAVLSFMFAFYGFMFSMAALDSSKLLQWWMIPLAIVFWVVAAVAVARPSVRKTRREGIALVEAFAENIQPVQATERGVTTTEPETQPIRS